VRPFLLGATDTTSGVDDEPAAGAVVVEAMMVVVLCW
jgi:hypothetical protein